MHKPMKVREMVGILRDAGFVLTRTNGSHRVFTQWANGQRGRSLVISAGDRETIGVPIVRKILRDAGIV